MKSPALNTIRLHGDRYFKHTDRVLDIGCGPGDITFEIARRSQEVWATDISRGMIISAQDRAIKQNLDNIQFVRTDLADPDDQSQLSSQSGLFDVVTAFNMLQYAANKQYLFGRLYELLKPGGLFISATACLGDRKTLPGFTLKVLSKIKLVPEIVFYKSRELENEIKVAGFDIIESGDIASTPERLIFAKRRT